MANMGSRNEELDMSLSAGFNQALEKEVHMMDDGELSSSMVLKLVLKMFCSLSQQLELVDGYLEMLVEQEVKQIQVDMASQGLGHDAKLRHMLHTLEDKLMSLEAKVNLLESGQSEDDDLDLNRADQDVSYSESDNQNVSCQSVSVISVAGTTSVSKDCSKSSLVKLAQKPQLLGAHQCAVESFSGSNKKDNLHKSTGEVVRRAYRETYIGSLLSPKSPTDATPMKDELDEVVRRAYKETYIGNLPSPNSPTGAMAMKDELDKVVRRAYKETSIDNLQSPMSTDGTPMKDNLDKVVRRAYKETLIGNLLSPNSATDAMDMKDKMDEVVRRAYKEASIGHLPSPKSPTDSMAMKDKLQTSRYSSFRRDSRDMFHSQMCAYLIDEDQEQEGYDIIGNRSGYTTSEDELEHTYVRPKIRGKSHVKEHSITDVRREKGLELNKLPSVHAESSSAATTPGGQDGKYHSSYSGIGVTDQSTWKEMGSGGQEHWKEDRKQWKDFDKESNYTADDELPSPQQMYGGRWGGMHLVNKDVDNNEWEDSYQEDDEDSETFMYENNARRKFKMIDMAYEATIANMNAVLESKLARRGWLEKEKYPCGDKEKISTRDISPRRSSVMMANQSPVYGAIVSMQEKYGKDARKGIMVKEAGVSPKKSKGVARKMNTMVSKFQANVTNKSKDVVTKWDKAAKAGSHIFGKFKDIVAGVTEFEEERSPSRRASRRRARSSSKEDKDITDKQSQQSSLKRSLSVGASSRDRPVVEQRYANAASQKYKRSASAERKPTRTFTEADCIQRSRSKSISEPLEKVIQGKENKL